MVGSKYPGPDPSRGEARFCGFELGPDSVLACGPGLAGSRKVGVNLDEDGLGRSGEVDGSRELGA
jgi:hypothetical protein